MAGISSVGSSAVPIPTATASALTTDEAAAAKAAAQLLLDQRADASAAAIKADQAAIADGKIQADETKSVDVTV